MKLTFYSLLTYPWCAHYNKSASNHKFKIVYQLIWWLHKYIICTNDS